MHAQKLSEERLKNFISEISKYQDLELVCFVARDEQGNLLLKFEYQSINTMRLKTVVKLFLEKGIK